MTLDEIEIKLKRAVRFERECIRETIEAIALAERRKLFAHRVYTSMFVYLIDELKYPADGAHRRLSAARISRDVPEVLDKLDDGSLNLTTLSRASSVIRAQEKVTNAKLSSGEKTEVLRAIENKSVADAEKIIFRMLPQAGQLGRKESTKLIDGDTTRVTICLSGQEMSFLDRARDILSHAIPDGAIGKVIGRVLGDFVTCSKTNKRTDGHSCEYVDPKTGRRCGSTFMLQRDHITPRALGGTDAPENMRWLCKTHNLLEAERILGEAWANAWRNVEDDQPGAGSMS